MNSNEVNQLIQHYPDIQILSPEKELSIATKMDNAMEQLAQVVLVQEHLLEQVCDILVAQYQSSPDLDDFLTQYDLLLLARHSEALTKDINVSESSLSVSLIHLPCDRSNVFDFLLAQVNQIEVPLCDYAQKLKKQYELSRNQLVQGNIRLVMHIAKRFANKGVDTEELIQEGSIGLIKAAEKYNLHKGFRFTTYAYWWIQQAIKNALNQKRSAIRIPINTSDRIFKIELAKQQYYNRYEELPTLKQLQKLTGLKQEQILSVSNVGNLTVSMNAPVYEDGLMLEEILVSEENTATYSNENMLNINDKDYLRSMIKQLPKRQQTIVYLYHGIGINDSLSFGEIAPQIGVTLERTRQLYHKSIAFLRELSHVKTA
ncbi:MAG: sigma-70 family RNA polymerase sigma factor [Oleispira antarctica]|uniref:RNA polymerase sigma-A factor n=1 Tax=Oleispira antarctica RB-8 TaxID=698738 RepID=R4YPE8_OLEAN|nr:sigma-70 family RNA polymerase sigma factor [Oleispira antarctica]MBQ0792857.1 sigma-70 family RNA polymerase sigma factor [Oleispira antarctica]CCK76937.1 RNA polymerase sigma-A factor [Oleispira antarctica RB-8]